MKRNAPILLFCLAAYILARGAWALTGPFILPFETAFQEAIALHTPLFNLPIIARLSGETFYHTAHPPLLINLYRLIYTILGGSLPEWSTRFCSLTLYGLSLLLWSAMLPRDAKGKWMIFLLGLFLPVPFILATSTNYEPISIFFISLITLLLTRERPRLGLIIPVLFLGLLADWPVYLAVPALIVIYWKDQTRRKLLLGLFAFEIVFFAGLMALIDSVAGEMPFFSHAPERANPLALLHAATYTETASHFFSLMSLPSTIIACAAVIAFAIYRGRDTLVAATIYSGRPDIPVGPVGTDRNVCPTTKKEPDRNVGPTIKPKFDPALFFCLHLLILFLSAPKLVARHEVYLLYFVPFLVFALREVILRAPLPPMALAAVLLVALPQNIILRYQRNPNYLGLALEVRNKGLHTAFSTAAVGTWYYYAGLETGFPVSKAMAKWIENHTPDLHHADLRHSEVSKSLMMETPPDSGYFWFRSIPGELVEIKKNDLLFSKFNHALWGCDLSDNIEVSSYTISLDQPTCKVSRCDEKFCPPITTSEDCSLPIYGLYANPGIEGKKVNCLLDDGRPKLNTSMIHFPSFEKSEFVRFPEIDKKNVNCLLYNRRPKFTPAIIHSLPFGKSDGVTFIWVQENLRYARFLASGAAPETELLPSEEYYRCLAYKSGKMDEEAKRNYILGALDGIAGDYLITLPGPKGNNSFDDAYWTNMKSIPNKEEEK